MKWRKWTSNSIILTDTLNLTGKSLPKGYSISKSVIKSNIIYELWQLPEQINLGQFNSADDAKEYCEKLK